MLKTISTVSPPASAKIRDGEQDGKEVQVENWDEEEPAHLAPKSHKSLPKDQKTDKSQKWIQAKKSQALRAKKFSSQSGLFLTSEVRKAFTKLRQAFVEAPILNYFNPEHYIQIETDAFDYAIDGILSQRTLDDLGR